MSGPGKVLRAAREGAGLSLGELAALTAYSKPYLSQLETGRRVVAEQHVSAYERALGVRLDVHAGSILSAAAGAVATDQAALDAASVVLANLRKLASVDVMPAVEAHRSVVNELARNARSAIRPRVVSLLSSVDQFLGWLSLNAGRTEDSRMYLDRAAVLAMQADAPMRLATALSFSAYRNVLQADHAAAVDLCSAAGRDARLHPGMVAYLRYQAAEILAQDRQPAEALRVLREADALADRLPVGHGPWHEPAFYIGHRAMVLGELGDISEASRAAQEALTLLPGEAEGQPLRLRTVRAQLERIA